MNTKRQAKLTILLWGTGGRGWWIVVDGAQVGAGESLGMARQEAARRRAAVEVRQ